MRPSVDRNIVMRWCMAVIRRSAVIVDSLCMCNISVLIYAYALDIFTYLKPKSFHLALRGAILIIFWLGGGEPQSAFPQILNLSELMVITLTQGAVQGPTVLL